MIKDQQSIQYQTHHQVSYSMVLMFHSLNHYFTYQKNVGDYAKLLPALNARGSHSRLRRFTLTQIPVSQNFGKATHRHFLPSEKHITQLLGPDIDNRIRKQRTCLIWARSMNQVVVDLHTQDLGRSQSEMTASKQVCSTLAKIERGNYGRLGTCGYVCA